jgi:glucosamine 6-phosphate synthetase-like amidotransferase/phosphosugar isomerase protein
MVRNPWSAGELSLWVCFPIPQLLAHYRAVGKGLDPDRPRNLDSVVLLNESSFSQG